MGEGREQRDSAMTKYQAVHGQIAFSVDTAVPAPKVAVLGDSKKKALPRRAEREMCLCGWCPPCMQSCKVQLDCRGEEEGEAHDRTHVHCLQDEATRRDKAGTQSSTASQCCH